MRWKKHKAEEDLSNDRSIEESKIQQSVHNPRYEEEKEVPSVNKKREEMKFEKEKDIDDSYGTSTHHAMISSDEDYKEMDDSNETEAKTKKKRSGKSGKGKNNKKK